MKRLYLAGIGLGCALVASQNASAITVDELGNGPGQLVTIHVTGVGTVPVDACVLQLNVGGVTTDGFCIDPFHFSFGSMTGYQAVELTSAPKGRFMSADTALEIERLWGSYYSPSINSADAAGLQIAIWELTGGSDFKLCSNNDFGAAGFLATVQDPNYSGPVADLVGLTGPGQDYGIQRSAVTVADTGSTLLLFTLALCGLAGLHRPSLKLAVVGA